MTDIVKPSTRDVDFQPEAADPAEPLMVLDSSEVELAAAPITWRWGRPADMAALRLCHFRSEVAAGEPLYLPEQPSDQRTIAVAERDGQIIGGILTEDSIAVTTIGLDPEVIESAAAGVIPAILSVARQEGTRFLQLSLPASLAATLTDALQKVGFKQQETVQFLLDTGVENQNAVRRKPQ